MKMSKLIIVLVLILHSFNIYAQNPWDEPQDSAMAINSPDQYAWQLFIALNWPADINSKLPDTSKPFGDDGPVVWETWRNVSNSAPDTVFRPDGQDPGEWLSGVMPSMRKATESDNLPLQQMLRMQHDDIFGNNLVPFVDPEVAGRPINETRVNKETYEFIRENELYNIEGQEALVEQNILNIQFPLNAKEIKAQWREIDELDKPRYHWAEIEAPDGQIKIVGLTALHITTKDLPNWFWATFEHIDNKLSEAEGGKPGNEGWLLASIDRFACANPPHDCDQSPTGIGLENTKWEHYVLRGTQIDFIDARGNSTILANSQPEQGFQLTSSCITCHAMATIGPKTGEIANRLNFFDSRGQSFNGPPQAGWFEIIGSDHDYTQLDFVWSLFRARRKSN